MNKSDTIGELARALIEVQKVLEGAKKDAINPFFKAKYADLSSVWDACRKPLGENGLAVTQTLDFTDGAGVVVETTLLHSSGEWISGRLCVTPVKNDPQGIGSAITYARRYSLAAIVGICPEDDDAEQAMDREKPAGHWCSEHEQVWFKKGKMQNYAHPIGETGEWCNEPTEEKVEKAYEPSGITKMPLKIEDKTTVYAFRAQLRDMLRKHGYNTVSKVASFLRDKNFENHSFDELTEDDLKKLSGITAGWDEESIPEEY